MNDWVLSTLHAWHRKQKNRGLRQPDPLNITIFGSFLDRVSLDFIYHIIHSPYYANNRSRPRIEIGILPVSKSKNEYGFLIQRFHKFLSEDQGDRLLDQLFHFIQDATNSSTRTTRWGLWPSPKRTIHVVIFSSKDQDQYLFNLENITKEK
jgi:hypothetical protein